MFSDAYNPELSDTEKAERMKALDNLKTAIREHFEKKNLPEKVKNYTGIWNAEKEKVTDLEAWGENVFRDILAECKSHAEETWHKVPKNWQEQELALLDSFIEAHTQTFCGRKPLLEELKKHLLSGNSANWGLVLTGESGSGKSAVFSLIYKMMQKEDCFILAHSAGLSPRAKNVADLLQIWNQQLAGFNGKTRKLVYIPKYVWDEDMTTVGKSKIKRVITLEQIQERFTKLLRTVAKYKKVVLLIDALDQFEPTARAQHVSWLPVPLPQNVRCIITSTNLSGQNAVKYHRDLNEINLNVFSAEEAGEMLHNLCKR